MSNGAQIRRGPVIVRPVIEADFEQWLPLWKGYNAFYRRAGKTALAKEITLTTWRRFFDPYEPVHALVAERGADLVGLAHYLFHRNTLMPTGTCYLQDLFTSKAARGKGVGRRLIHALGAAPLAPADRSAQRDRHRIAQARSPGPGVTMYPASNRAAYQEDRHATQVGQPHSFFSCL